MKLQERTIFLVQITLLNKAFALAEITSVRTLHVQMKGKVSVLIAWNVSLNLYICMQGLFYCNNYGSMHACLRNVICYGFIFESIQVVYFHQSSVVAVLTSVWIHCAMVLMIVQQQVVQKELMNSLQSVTVRTILLPPKAGISNRVCLYIMHNNICEITACH